MFDITILQPKKHNKRAGDTASGSRW